MDQQVTHAATTTVTTPASGTPLPATAVPVATPAVPGGPGSERHVTTGDVAAPATETIRTETHTDHVPAKDVKVEEKTVTRE